MCIEVVGGSGPALGPLLTEKPLSGAWWSRGAEPESDEKYHSQLFHPEVNRVPSAHLEFATSYFKGVGEVGIYHG